MFRKLWRWIVRTGFRLLYNEMAWTYDLVSWVVSLGEWRKWQEAALAFVQGERVLEIAHGPGHMLLALSDAGWRVTGLDLSPHMGRIAWRRVRTHARRISLVRGDVQALPFCAQTFDTVYCTFPTYFIAQNETMEAVQRVLRPGGRYLIVPEGHLTSGGIVQRFISWLYAITGQRDDVFAVNEEDFWPGETPAWRTFSERMQQSGFTIEVHKVRLARSAATVIVATRTEVEYGVRTVDES